MREPLMSASLVLDDEDNIVEINGDVYDFLGIADILGKPFPQVSPDIYRMLQRLISKGKRGRGVEGYALSFKIGKRLMGAKVSVIPYPLPALGRKGILISIASMEERLVPAPGRREETPKPATPAGEAVDRDTLSTGVIPFIGDPLCLINRRGEIEYANQALLRLLKYSLEELRGKPFYSLLSRGEAKRTAEQVMETAHLAPWRGELTLHDQEGKEVILHFTFNAFREKEGSLGILGIAKDFTELRRMWREKELASNRMWEMADKVGMALFTFTPDQRITFWNKEAERLLSLSMDRAIGMGLREIFGEEAEAEFSSSMAEARHKAGVVERVMTSVSKGAIKKVYRLKVARFGDKDSLSEEFVCCVEDVTEDRNREAALIRKEMAYELMQGVASLARTGKRLEDYLSEALREIMKHLEAEAGGIYIFEGEYAVLKASQGISEGFLDKAKRWRIRPTRLEIFRESPGTIIDLESPGGDRDFNVLRPVLRDWDLIIEAIAKEGLLRNYILPIVTRERTLGVVVLGNYSRERLEEIGFEYMTSVGSILGMGAEKVLLAMEMDKEIKAARRVATVKDDYIRLVSHEMGAPLTYIHGYAEMLKGSLEQMDKESIQDKLGNIILGCERLMHIREGLQRSLQLERGKLSGMVETVQPELYFREVLERHDFLKGRTVETHFPEDLPPFRVDSYLLGEAVYQLLYNAERMALPGEKICIRGERGADEIVFRIEFRSGEEKAEVQERLFEEEEEGAPTEIAAHMNLDTYLVKHFLEKLGGRIEVQMDAEMGTVVTLYLPLGGTDEE